MGKNQKEENTNEGIESPELSFPKGGGSIQGLGETLKMNPFSGSFCFSIPFPITPSRDYTPKISLEYDSALGNGIFGMGFQISIPMIVRKTTLGVPNYDDTDTFIFSQAQELVRIQDKQKDVVDENGETWTIYYYIPRTEGMFTQFEYWVHDELSYWKIRSIENEVSIYGKYEEGKVYDPKDKGRVFSWLIEESKDAKGNRIQYQYKKEDGKNTHNFKPKQGNIEYANRYIHSITYGNYHTKSNNEEMAFEVLFDYGEYDITEEKLYNSESNPLEVVRDWEYREDPFISYRSGFALQTCRLCKNIYMIHHFKEEFKKDSILVSSIILNYSKCDISNPTVQLKEASLVGYQFDAKEGYRIKTMPPIKLSYVPFQPEGQPFRKMKYHNSATSHDNLNLSTYQMVDLYGDGISGLFYSGAGQMTYCEPRGNGTYQVHNPRQFPINRNTMDGKAIFAGLDGSGRLDLVVCKSNQSGYYAANPDGSWNGYHDFLCCPTELLNPERELLDINGGGFLDLFMRVQDGARIYSSLQQRGFAEAVTVALPFDFPYEDKKSQDELVCFCDLLGDGLPHRVRIRNGCIEYWPNLGHGQFGERRVLENAPSFEHNFNFHRLYLADVSGNGMVDFIYVHTDFAEIYFNQCGNGLSAPIRILFPEQFTSNDWICFGDVEGSGCSSLIFNKVGEQVTNYYYSFTGGKKPYLLAAIDNSMGALTTIQYQSSVFCYLNDRLEGREWKTKLPFPVSVVDKIECVEQITGTKLTQNYRYHEGYYDYTERLFCGFGFVEQMDAQEQGVGQQVNETSEIPILIKQWYHTGSVFTPGRVTKHFEEEYYQGDADSYYIPDSSLDESINSEAADTFRQACVALKGQLLREEIYALDNDVMKQKTPYQVSESNFHVRCIQPAIGKQKGSFLVCGKEKIQYSYERDERDPRVTHAFVLETDSCGNQTKVCEIVYPRRKQVKDAIMYDTSEQYQLRGTLQWYEYAIVTESGTLTRQISSIREYNLRKIELGNTMYFGFEKIKKMVEQAWANQTMELIQWEQYYYWDVYQESPLPLGQTTSRVLLHHVEKALISDDFLKDVLQGRYGEDIIIHDCGYVLSQGYWWNLGLVNYYYKEEKQKYFLPYQSEHSYVPKRDSNYTNIIYEYDTYALLKVSKKTFVTENVFVTECVTIDYRFMKPWQLLDQNDNLKQVLFDPLGMVVVSTSYAEIDEMAVQDEEISRYRRVPDEKMQKNSIVENSKEYLQGADTFFYYDVNAWSQRGQPACYLSIQRDTWEAALKPLEETGIQLEVGYQDGLGRELQTKKRTNSNTEWITSGENRYNKKGKPIIQYAPYYSNTWDYVPLNEEDPLKLFPVFIQYDPLMREVRRDFPKGFFSRVEFTPWEVSNYDSNDTMKDSKYYHDFFENYPENPTQLQLDERDALCKTEQSYGTKNTIILDNRGEIYLEVAYDEKMEPCYTRYWLDAKGNVIASADPRMYQLSNGTGQIYKNVEYTKDLNGNTIKSVSLDAGESYVLKNIYDKEVHCWSARGYHRRTSYDHLQRQTAIEIEDETNTSRQVVQRFIYAEATSNTLEELKRKNKVGKIVQVWDQSGVTEYEKYSPSGKPLIVSKQLRKEYETTASFDTCEKGTLQEQVFVTQYEYNALNQKIKEQMPDQSQVMASYNLLGLTSSISYRQGEVYEDIIKDISYNCFGQRSRIDYGNDVTTRYEYEETTMRLRHIQTVRVNGQIKGRGVIQSVFYTYDPVGNVTRVRDDTYDTILYKQEIIEPVSDYTYDTFNQLICAKGRQHEGSLPDNGERAYQKPNKSHENDKNKLENYTQSYRYDMAGNQTDIRHKAPSASWNHHNEIEPETNRTQWVSSYNDTYQTPYDIAGNLLCLGNSMELNWNENNQLVKVNHIVRDTGNNDCDYYIYDSSGQRVRKVCKRLVDSQRYEIEETIYIGNYERKTIRLQSKKEEQTILERNTNLIMDGNHKIAIRNHWTIDCYRRETEEYNAKIIRYHIGNGMDSCVLELDQLAQIITYEEYYPYGGTSLMAGKGEKEIRTKEYRYCSKERDASTGLYYYGARYYPPWLGRWLNTDPSGMGDGLNLYTFVHNNPITYTDEGGNTGGSWLAKLFGGAATLAVGGILGLFGYSVDAKGAIAGGIAAGVGAGVETITETLMTGAQGTGTDVLMGMAITSAAVMIGSYVAGRASQLNMSVLGLAGSNRVTTYATTFIGTAIAVGGGVLASNSASNISSKISYIPSMIGSIGGSILASGAHFGWVITGGAKLPNRPLSVSESGVRKDLDNWVVQAQVDGYEFLELNSSEFAVDVADAQGYMDNGDMQNQIPCDMVVVHGFPGFAFLDEPGRQYHMTMNKIEVAKIIKDRGFPHINSKGNIPIKFVSCFGGFGLGSSTAQHLAKELHTDIYACDRPVAIRERGVWKKFSAH